MVEAVRPVEPPVFDDLTQRVMAVIAASREIPVETISVDSTFEELGLDSLDGINILFALEEEFGIDIPDEAAREITSIRLIIENLRPLIQSPADGPYGGEAVGAT